MKTALKTATAMAVVMETVKPFSFMTENVMTRDEFFAFVAKTRESALTTQEQIVMAGKHALLHFHRTGDTDFINQLILSMPDGQRVKALLFWIKAHAPITFDKSSKRYVKDKGENALPVLCLINQDKESANYGKNMQSEENIIKANKLLSEAWATPYYEFSKERDPEDTPENLVFLKTSLESLLKRYAKIEEENRKAGKMPAAEVTEIVNNLKGIVNRVTEIGVG